MNTRAKSLLSTVTVAALAVSVAQAEELAVESIQKAGEVIAETIEAYGGAEKITGLNSVSQDSKSKGLATNQSRKPEPPWDRNETESTNAIDFEQQVFVTTNKGAAGGFEFDNINIINGEESSYNLNLRAGTAAPVAQPDFNTTSGPFIRITAPLLVKQLQNRSQTSTWIGVEDVEGRPHDLITLVMEVGPALVMYIDQETRMINKMERILPAFGVVGYRFENYQKVDGIPFNQRFVLYLNDDLNLEIDNSNTRVNTSIAAMAAVPSELELVAAIQPDELKLNEIDEGVYLVGGAGTYAMFVDMGDYVVAVGGTAGIPDRIAELRKVVPTKPIQYAVLTHHHNDHIVGVPTYADEGATILTVSENESVVRGVAGEEQELDLEFVSGKRVFTSGGRTLEIIDVGPTPHVDHLLVAYLPEEGIVFEADHFAQPVNGVIPPGVSNTYALVEALEKHNIEAKTIVGAHSPRVGSSQDLQAAVSE